jgi:hypothetical protein
VKLKEELKQEGLSIECADPVATQTVMYEVGSPMGSQIYLSPTEDEPFVSASSAPTLKCEPCVPVELNKLHPYPFKYFS